MRKIILIIIISILILFIGYIVYATFFHKAGKEAFVNIKSGQSTGEIAQNLKDQGVISSPLLFSLYVYKNHYLLQSGVYKITASMTMPQIVTMIKDGKVQEYLVTIPEGWRLTQIDELLSEKGIIQINALTKIATADEGYLFPDTYHFELDSTVQSIRSQMLNDFKKQTEGLTIDRQTLIIASIVEREAKFDDDRAKIAGVYLSRLDQGMKLEADPTVQYAKGSWEPITTSDYKNVISPYNTYLNAGLPPGPICNPGLKSIEATLHPVKDGSLYFFTDKTGHAVFSKTLDEQNVKINNR